MLSIVLDEGGDQLAIETISNDTELNARTDGDQGVMD